jgi:hypothetical protein
MKGEPRRADVGNGVEMSGIMIKSADVWIRVNAIQRKRKKSELSYVAGKSGSTRMAYREFKGEWEALNLEGCVGLGYQAQLGLEELQRVLTMIDIPDSAGGCITLSRG